MNTNMFFRIVSLVVCLTVIPVTFEIVSAEEPPVNRTQPGANDLFKIGEMATAAADLRKAAEAFERFGNSLDGIVGSIAESLAAMSSGFDPFGYKTAFHTIGQQSETIQQQHEEIRELLEREIERLRVENSELKKQRPRKRRGQRE